MPVSSCYFQVDIVCPVRLAFLPLNYGDKDSFTGCVLVIYYSKSLTPNNFYRIKI